MGKQRKSEPAKAKRRRSVVGVRREIDEIDQKIIDLLNRRASLAQSVGEVKARQGREMFDPARQHQILSGLAKRNPGPFPNEALRQIWTEIMGACLSLEKPLRVGFLGPEASYSNQAVIEEFGHEIDTVPLASIPDVFTEVETGRCDYGLVPIENSTEGVVHFTMDRLLDSSLQICAERNLRIRLSLLAKSKSVRAIRRVYSHPQPLRQCRRWLLNNLPKAELIEVSSTTRGAELAAKTAGSGAIGAAQAAALHRLKVVADSIEDEADNTTRFLVIGREHPGPSGNDKTSIMFTLLDKPGALVSVLEPLQRAGINMTNIDVRPSRRRAFDYIFFLDLEGHIATPKMRAAIDRLREHCVTVKVLGSYPRS